MNIKKKSLLIGIDARFYGSEDGGLGRYNENLISNLQRIDPINRYKIFLPQKYFKKCKIYNKNFSKVVVNIDRYSLKEQLIYPFRLYKEKVDLMHFPHINVPLLYRKSYILTVHDLIMHSYSTRQSTTRNPILYKLIKKSYLFITKNAIATAKKVITVSKFSQKVIYDKYPSAAGKVSYIYEGISTNPGKDGKFEKNIPREYILYVGNAYPHKNLEILIKSFKIFKKCNEKESCLKLLIVGNKDIFYKRLLSWIKKENLGRDIVFKFNVRDEDLNSLYRGALVFVFPSKMEGFGLPPLEAMSNNTPVISSNSHPMPEILGEAPLYFNPDNIVELVEKLSLVYSNQTIREKMISKGRAQLANYSWRKMAKSILTEYKNIKA